MPYIFCPRPPSLDSSYATGHPKLFHGLICDTKGIQMDPDTNLNLVALRPKLGLYLIPNENVPRELGFSLPKSCTTLPLNHLHIEHALYL
jgi:hypothetical protein